MFIPGITCLCPYARSITNGTRAAAIPNARGRTTGLAVLRRMLERSGQSAGHASLRRGRLRGLLLGSRQHELPDLAGFVEAELSVELLRPVGGSGVGEDQCGAPGARGRERSRGGRTRKAPAADAPKGEDVLDVRRSPVGV